ncbi:MAG: hypothetical protein ACYS5W_04495, partial [Planctomycetota bacterium]
MASSVSKQHSAGGEAEAVPTVAVHGVVEVGEAHGRSRPQGERPVVIGRRQLDRLIDAESAVARRRREGVVEVVSLLADIGCGREQQLTVAWEIRDLLGIPIQRGNRQLLVEGGGQGAVVPIAEAGKVPPPLHRHQHVLAVVAQVGAGFRELRVHVAAAEELGPHRFIGRVEKAEVHVGVWSEVKPVLAVHHGAIHVVDQLTAQV